MAETGDAVVREAAWLRRIEMVAAAAGVKSVTWAGSDVSRTDGGSQATSSSRRLAVSVKKMSQAAGGSNCRIWHLGAVIPIFNAYQQPRRELVTRATWTGLISPRGKRRGGKGGVLN